jgi:hypothetical protein
VVKIATTPSGAQIYLDGKKLPQVSPSTLDEMESGKEHTLVLMLPGYKDAETKFTVHSRQMTKVELALERDPKLGLPKNPIVKPIGTKPPKENDTGEGITLPDGQVMPTTPIMQKVVAGTLRDAADGFKEGDFQKLYDDASSVFRSQFSIDQIKSEYGKLVGVAIDPKGISSGSIKFTKPPRLGKAGEAVVSGYASLADGTIRFNATYVFEKPTWKLAGLSLGAQEKLK